MIVVTGAAGFIGSCLVSRLNQEGYKDVVVVDDFSRADKKKNLQGKIFKTEIHRDVFPAWLKDNHRFVQFIFHLGARTNTTEFDKTIFDRLNVQSSKNTWLVCAEYGIPFVYASSAATYGGGENGYDDSHELIGKLKPLNPYGESKQEFDVWMLENQKKAEAEGRQLPFWAGLKFFNVYGPNEYHKGRMASVVFHAFNQIQKEGKIKLFRSHNPKFKDGEQLRDFIYIKDVLDVCLWLLNTRKGSSIYNLGSGTARTFLDLAQAVFSALNKKTVIEFIDTPMDIREKYQYYTQARMNKLGNAGYSFPFTSLESGVGDYITKYLSGSNYL